MIMAEDNAKLVASLSYITWIGWIVALIMHLQKKSDFGGFHLRQALIIMIASFILMWVWWIAIIGWALGLLVLILWIMGLINAIQGVKKEVPVIGGLAQQWFKGL